MVNKNTILFCLLFTMGLRMWFLIFSLTILISHESQLYLYFHCKTTA